MGGRYGGDIKGKRFRRSRERWTLPPQPKPRPDARPLDARGALIAGVGFYILSLAGLLLLI